jgi:hypothetical protein
VNLITSFNVLETLEEACTKLIQIIRHFIQAVSLVDKIAFFCSASTSRCCIPGSLNYTAPGNLERHVHHGFSEEQGSRAVELRETKRRLCGTIWKHVDKFGNLGTHAIRPSQLGANQLRAVIIFHN